MLFDEVFVKTFPGFLSIRNAKHQIVYLNDNFKNWIHSYTDVEPLGKTNEELAALVPPNVAEVFLQCHDASLRWQENCTINQTFKKVINFKDTTQNKDKTQYFEVLKYGLIIDGQQHIFTIGYDVTTIQKEKQNYLETIERMSSVDDLTGERNFSKFQEDAKQILETATSSYALIKLDIENFKLINKTMGFATGDHVLKTVSDTIRTIITSPENSIFTRSSIDEFIILHKYKTKENFYTLRRAFLVKFRELLGQHFNYNIRFKIGVCIIAHPPTAQDSLQNLLEAVNFAHRQSKQDSLVDIVFYDENLSNEALYLKHIENHMKKALLENEFVVYLQPKYILKKNALGGAEALVRWYRDDKILQPMEFIPLFEKNGFITRLDFYMLKNVCRIISGWIADGITPVVVSVNFSRQHLNNSKVVADICKIVDSFELEHKWIEIEFTESSIYENLEIFETILAQLHEAGFTVSMDDFGNGYSSLGVLKNLPVDAIKIDRTFFVQQKDEERSKTVIGCVIDMASKLGIHTIAEGVEELHHIDLLKALDCDMVQGFYFAKPMPEEAFLKLLK